MTLTNLQVVTIHAAAATATATAATAKNLKAELFPALKRALLFTKEKGASSWLIALPIEEHGFSLHKGLCWCNRFAV